MCIEKFSEAGHRPRRRSSFFSSSIFLLLAFLAPAASAATRTGLVLEFEMAPVAGKNPSGVAVSTGQILVVGDWQNRTYGSMHFYLNSAHYGADQGARIVTYALPAPDGGWHKITVTYDLQTVTIQRDGVVVVKDWLDQQTTEIPSRPGPAVNFNTPMRNLKVTPLAVPVVLPEVRWQGIIGNSSSPQSGAGVWSTFFPALKMVAWGNKMIGISGYNEGKPELWMFDNSNPQNLERTFGLRHGTTSSADVPVDVSVANGNLYVLRAGGKVTAFNPATGLPIGDIKGTFQSFPAPPARPVANADSTWSFNGRTVGEPGGYANGVDIKLTRFGHYYIDGSRVSRACGAFQSDGKVWVSDTATARLIRFNADGTPDGTVIHWTPHSYTMAVDKTDRSRAFNRFIEYRGGVPVRFYGHVATADMLGFGAGFYGVTQVGGKTLALTAQGGTKQIVELTATGLASVQKNLPKDSRFNRDGTVSDVHKIVADGVTYAFNPWKGAGDHLTATRNGTVLWRALPAGDNSGNGTFDLRTEYPAQPGTFAVAGNYVIVACQMEFWRVPKTGGYYEGQGNQLFIFDRTTGRFLRQFGLPMLNRGEVDNPPGAASNIFTLDAEQNADGSVTVWANDESNRGIIVWKIDPSSPSSVQIPTVTVSASDASAAETGSDPGVFTISRAASDLGAPLTVNFTLAGSAQNGTDYNALGTSITIPAGAASTTLVVTPKTDSLTEGTETILLSLNSSSTYSLGSAAATINLLDAATIPANNPPPAAGLPDLIVTGFSISPVAPKSGEQIRFTATIKNNGTAATVAAGVGFFVDNGAPFSTPGNAQAWTGVPALAVGQSATVSSAIGSGGVSEPGVWTATVGNHQLAVFVDDNKAITESSEANNTLTLALTVATTTPPPPPPLPVITVQATDPNAAEPSAPGTFTITRTGATGTALILKYALTGTALNGTDYNSIPATATIPAGASSITINVNPIDNSVIEPTETVILTLQPAPANYTLGSPLSATVNITDNDTPPPLPQISVQATSPNAAEPSTPGVFTITRTGDTSIALVVKYALAGTAANGTDYTFLPALATMPAGASSVAVTVNPIDNLLIESTETIILTLQPTPATYTLGTPVAATVNLADNDTPAPPPPPGSSDLIITDFSMSPAAPKAGETVRFTATVKNQGTAATPINTTVVVGFYVDGGDNFVNGGTPKAWTSTANLAPGASITVVSKSGLQTGLWTATAGNHSVAAIVDIPNRITEGNESNNTAVAQLYVAPAAQPSTAVTPLVAPPAVTVIASDPAAAEIGDAGLFTFRRSGGTNSNLTIYFHLKGTATYAKDYAQMPGSVTIPAGLTSVSLPLLPTPDSFSEGDETAILVLTSNTTYRVVAPNTATITILDNGSGGTHYNTAPATAARVSLSLKSGTTTERTNDFRYFVFTRRGSWIGDLRVNYSASGTAGNGVDYLPVSGSIIIPDGKASASVLFKPVHDLTTELTESATLTILPSPNYNIGVANVTAFIRDNDVDTDKDGVSDQQEILNGTNRLDPNSH